MFSNKISRTHFKGPLFNGGNLTVITVDPTLTPTAHTASATLTVADFGTIHTNTGVGSRMVLTLPAANTVENKAIKFQQTAAVITDIMPATGEVIYLGGDGVASKYLRLAGTISHYADLYCDGSQFMVMGYSGVVTKEA